MNGLKLNDRRFLYIETEGKRLRLIVQKDGQEEVCRKENSAVFKRFLASGQERIFKGRLQLVKADDKILIHVKGETIGKVTAEILLNCVEKSELKPLETQP